MSLTCFDYQAADADGKLCTGQLNAESEREAVAQLQARHLVPVRVQPARRQAATGRSRGLNSADLVDFTQGLCTLVEARVPLDRALVLLEGITGKAHMKRLVQGLRRDLKEGRSLAEAMEARPDVFSRLYVNVVRAGETGGILDQLLPELAAYLESVEHNRRQVVAAMVYPAILLITGVLSVALLLAYVVPQFAEMFSQSGIGLPPSVTFLVSLSDLLTRHGWLLFPLLLAFYLGWRWLDADSSRRLQRDAWLLRLPLLGKLLLYREVAIFARTLGALLTAGIPLIRGLRVARDVLGNAVLVSALTQVEEDVRSGAGLGAALARTGRFPVLLHQLVGVGEESGRTGQILKKLAQDYDQQVGDQTARLVNALQPALILLLGLVIGAIVIVMLSAVFSMNSIEF